MAVEATLRPVLALLTLASALSVLPARAHAHCDTISGPVITDARSALEQRDVTPVLKWIRPADEAEIRSLFQKTLIVRGQGEAARDLADHYFFETLVRVHRAGEGAPFTGLKQEPPDRPIALADEALQSGTSDELSREILSHLNRALRDRFAAALEARKHANDSVAAGREYVARYVELMHFIEALHGAAAAEENPKAHAHID